MVVATLAACGPGTANSAASTSRTAAHSPTAPAATSAPQAAGAYGVLLTAPQGNYTVSLIGIDGKVVATASTSGIPLPTCAGQAVGNVPSPLSTSDSRLYFQDGDGRVEYLTPDGQTGRATTVPAGTVSRRSMFAVSPDDRRIAVVVADFTSSGASTRLYVEDLNGGGNHVDLFSESGAFTLWPVGWHGTNNLVLGKVASCYDAGTYCCGPQELHVVDPATGTRRFTLGGPTCVPAGAPSPAGVVCEDWATFTKATVLNWTAGTVRTLPISGPYPAFLSPGGDQVAMLGAGPDSGILETGRSLLAMRVCGWIDNTHVFSAGDVNYQPRIADTTTGAMTTVAAAGTCGGRIPGGL